MSGYVIAHADGSFSREPEVLTSRRAEARDWMLRDTLEAAREICRRHGENPHGVPWIEYDLVDIPMLRFGRYDLDTSGRPQPDADYPDTIAMLPPVEHALVGQLPTWWKPSA